MIRNILFDLDDTLFDFRRAEREAVQKTLVCFNLPANEDVVRLYSEKNRQVWRLLEQGQITRERLKVRRFELLFEALGADTDPKEAAFYYENTLAVGHYFMPGAKELLEKLWKQYRLYIVSNGTAHVQHGRIDGSGLLSYVRGLFISEEIGYDKPDPAFFASCFAKIPDFKKEETIIVGDSLTSDIKGGNQSGIRAVWLNPEGVCNETDARPDAEIHSLLELEQWLETEKMRQNRKD